MNKHLPLLAIAAVLAACGGGGSSSTATPAATSTPAPVAQTTTPPTTAAQLVAMPAVPATAVKMSSGSVTLGTNAQDMDISFKAGVGLNVSGQLNRLWVAAAAGGGTTSVSGSQNTIVFRQGVESSVSVTGGSNTFYLAEGSPIKIEGAGAAQSTITYYKP